MMRRSDRRSMPEVFDDAVAEALRRDPDHERRWVVLLDGDLDPIDRPTGLARRYPAVAVRVAPVETLPAVSAAHTR